MATATYGHAQPLGSPEVEAALYVSDIGAARDQRRTAIESGIPDSTRVVVTAVAGAKHAPVESACELANRSIGNVEKAGTGQPNRCASRACELDELSPIYDTHG